MFSKSLLILSFVSVAFASVFITAPVASTIYSADSADAVVTWASDNSTVPKPSDFGPSTVSIYVGNANQQTKLQTISDNIDISKETTIKFKPDPTIGPNGNQYFVRIESISGVDPNSTLKFHWMSFSAKFTLSGMTGNFSSAIEAQIAGQSTAPLAGSSTTSGATGTATSTPSLTSSSATKTSTTSASASAKPSSGAMGLKAGWAGMVFGAVVGVAMF